MRPRLSNYTGHLKTGLRFALVAPLALVLSVLVMLLPVRNAPGFGFERDTLVCTVLTQVVPPFNWWTFIALEATFGALFAYALDRFSARWIGGYGRRASVGLGAFLFVTIVLLLTTGDVGVFC